MKGPNFKKDQCPYCLYKVDSVTEIHKSCRLPRPGDFSVCLSCGGFLRYNNELMLEPTDDLSDLSPEAFAYIKKAQDYIRQRGPL